MKYKVGDRVRVKSLEWYNKNKSENGNVLTKSLCFVPSMSKYCGKEATILDIDKYLGYHIDIDNKCWWWSEEILEDIRKEGNK